MSSHGGKGFFHAGSARRRRRKRKRKRWKKKKFLLSRRGKKICSRKARRVKLSDTVKVRKDSVFSIGKVSFNGES